MCSALGVGVDDKEHFVVGTNNWPIKTHLCIEQLLGKTAVLTATFQSVCRGLVAWSYVSTRILCISLPSLLALFSEKKLAFPNAGRNYTLILTWPAWLVNGDKRVCPPNSRWIIEIKANHIWACFSNNLFLGEEQELNFNVHTGYTCTDITCTDSNLLTEAEYNLIKVISLSSMRLIFTMWE